MVLFRVGLAGRLRIREIGVGIVNSFLSWRIGLSAQPTRKRAQGRPFAVEGHADVWCSVFSKLKANANGWFIDMSVVSPKKT